MLRYEAASKGDWRQQQHLTKLYSPFLGAFLKPPARQVTKEGGYSDRSY